MDNSGAASFSVSPRALAWYKSPDADRTFLILRITTSSASHDAKAPNPELLSLLRRCNTVAAAFNEKPLYEHTPAEPVGLAFHVSVGWTSGLPSDEASLKSLKVLKTKELAEVMAWDVGVSAVKVKIGNVVHHVPLRGRKSTTSGNFLER